MLAIGKFCTLGVHVFFLGGGVEGILLSKNIMNKENQQ